MKFVSRTEPGGQPTRPLAVSTEEKLIEKAFLRSRGNRLKGVDVKDGLVWHYTAAGALPTMLPDVDAGRNEVTLWASEATYLNDASEIRFGYDAIRAALQLLCSEEKEDRGLFELESQKVSYGDLSSKLKFNDGNVRLPFDRGSKFITCFCGQPDVLSQWYGYGGGGGVALGLNEDYFNDISVPLASEPGLPMGDREGSLEARWKGHAARWLNAGWAGGHDWGYDLVYAKVKYGVDAGLNAFRALSPVPDMEYAFPESIYMISSVLAPFYKHEGFWAEDERRICVWGDEVKKEFRTRGSGLVPYVPLGIPASALECVMIGPGLVSDQGKQRRAVEALLKRSRMESVKIVRSTIPYRG